MNLVKPKLWTKKGLEQLGELIKRSRENFGFSLRALADYIELRTEHQVSVSTLSGIERGGTRMPDWNTLAILAAAGFILKEDGTPYAVEDLSAVASETYLCSKNGQKEISRQKDKSSNGFDNLYQATLNTDTKTNVSTADWNNERVCLRAHALIKASLKKIGKTGRPGEAAEEAGVDPSTFDRSDLRTFARGDLQRMLGTRVNAGLESAIAAICYEVVGGWENNTPRGLGGTTYKDRPSALLRDLSLNNERQMV